MQAEIEKSRSYTHKKLRDLPGMSPSEILSEMPVCTFETGYFVPYKKANSIKSLMTGLAKSTTMLFSSKVVEGGIVVWKVTNDIKSNNL